MRIAISGAGIAGPTLAFWLLRAGHEPVLYEKAPRFRTGGYIIDFWGSGYTIAERMGLLPAIHERGYSINEVRIVDARGRRAGGFSTGVFRRATGNRFVSLPRGDLAEIIYRSIEDRVEAVFGDSITAIEQHDAGARLTFEHAPPRGFDLVVGADGLHSAVRTLAFTPEGQCETRLGYHVAAFEVVGYRPRDELAYVGFSIPGRQVARFAQRADRTLFFFILADGHMSAEEPRDNDERRRLLHRAFDGAGWECPQILDAMERANDIYFDRVSQIHMDRWSHDRVILIGDAAACVSFLAGEGTGLAMTEAYILAGELARAGGNFRAAFQTYEQLLRPLIERKQKAARGFAGAFAPKTSLGVWLRNQVSKLHVFPPLADFFVGRSVRDEIGLPTYDFKPHIPT